MKKQFPASIIGLLLLGVWLFVSSNAQGQVSDDCATAIPIACGSTATGTTVGATVDVIPAACSTPASPGVWYTFTGNGAVMQVSLCGSAYDTRIAVLTGTCGTFNCVASNDDACGTSSQVTVTTTLGTTYYVLVYGYGSASGSFTLNLTCPTPITNDACANAIPVVCGSTVTGTTSGATTDVLPAACGGTTASPGIWYSFVGTGQNVQFSLCGSAFDTRIAVMEGSCGGLVCNASNDDFCGVQSQVVVPTTLGTTYYILVFGFGSASGNFTFNVTCIQPAPNDSCATAETVVCGSTVTGNTSGASIDVVPAACGGNTTAPGVWYVFNGTGDNVVFSLCGSSYDTEISVMSGSCGNLTCLSSNDDYCGTSSQVVVATTVGTTYYILVHGNWTSSGNYTMSVSCLVPLANDACSGAIDIACGGSFSGNTMAGTPDPIPVGCSIDNTAPGIWYKFTGNGGPMTVSLCGSGYDTQMSIMTGSCANLTCIGYNNDSPCGTSSQYTVNTSLGTTYYVYVFGYYGAGGNFTISLSCPAIPPPGCYTNTPNGCPNIALGADINLPTCTSPCTPVTLTPTFLQTNATTSYSVCQIPYTPYPYNTGTGFSIGIDDRWTSAINLPFSFCFYGVNYTQCWVGSNGVITFTNPATTFCPWAFTASCPSAALPTNSIFGIYHDIDPSILCGGSPCGDARYATFGVAPCRVWVVSWDNVPHFSGVCNALRTSCEIVLYETTNVVEVYVESKPVCASWNYGNALIGLQNVGGTTGITPPNRNTGLWYAAYEGWRFSPSGASTTTINWYQQGNATSIGTGSTINVCPSQTTQTYVAQATYSKCDGSTIQVSDDIIIQCAMFLLPVEWKSFEVKNGQEDAFIDCFWTTSSENNNDYFSVERSADGENWTEIGRADGAGYSDSEKHYQFRDYRPLYGTSYYRIKQTDHNGNFDYSEIRPAQIQQEGRLYLYPNPSADFVQVNPWHTGYKLRLLDSSGRALEVVTDENGRMDVSGLQKGWYQVEVSDASKSLVYHLSLMIGK